MAPLEDVDQAPAPLREVIPASPRPTEEQHRPIQLATRGSRALRAQQGASTETAASPTTSIFHVLLALGIAFLVAILLDARGIVHSGSGMPDGPMRAATLSVGRTALGISQATHLTWPWDRIQAALGRSTQTSVPPLLASAKLRTGPGPARTPTQTHRSAFVGLSSPLPGPRLAPQPLSHPAAATDQGPPPLPVPSPNNPLRLLVAGDSLVGYLGPQLIDQAAHTGPVRGFVDTHNGTGLTRPDFVDWSVVARQQVAAYHPQAVVVMIGGNDFQNMTLPTGKVLIAGTPDWTREYQRRATVCMRVWLQGGARRVYWLSMPPSRDPAWAFDDRQINVALQRAAAQPAGAEYLNILGPITNHGQYADFVSSHGSPILIREPDGVHLNIAGSSIVAGEVLPVLRREWHLAFPVHHVHPKRHHGQRHGRRSSTPRRTR